MKRRIFIQFAGVLGFGAYLYSTVDANLLNSIGQCGKSNTNTSESIKIIGIGSLGENLIRSHLRNIEVEFSAIDLEKVVLGTVYDVYDSTAKYKAQEFFGLHPDYINEMLDGVQILLLLAGMGGLVGTVAAPIIAQAAKERGIHTIAVVSTPPEFEWVRRIRNAKNGLKEIYPSTDNLIVLSYEKLLQSMGENATFKQLFDAGTSMLAGMTRHIVENLKNDELARSTSDRNKVLKLVIEKAMAMGTEHRRSIMSIYQPDSMRPILS